MCVRFDNVAQDIPEHFDASSTSLDSSSGVESSVAPQAQGEHIDAVDSSA